MTLPGYAVVHRDSLSLGTLAIDGSGAYRVDDNGIGEAVGEYTQDVVSSPWVEGDTVTNEVRGMVVQTMRVQVRAADQSALQTAVGVLLQAFQQPSFRLDLVIGSATYSWSCRRRSYGLSFSRAMVFARITTVPVTFMRYPTPLSGAF